MQYFLGIIPNIDYQEKVKAFQKQWGVEITEPHITVKAQGGLTPDLVWLPKVIEICANYCEFQVTLGEPKYFGREVLYLSVFSNQLNEFHRNLVSVIKPSQDLNKMYYELDDFLPHLTLALGLSFEKLIEIKKVAEQILVPYPTFTVSSVRLYKQEQEGDQYTKYMDIELLE